MLTGGRHPVGHVTHTPKLYLHFVKGLLLNWHLLQSTLRPNRCLIFLISM